jgi:hypothetical protein
LEGIFLGYDSLRSLRALRVFAVKSGLDFNRKGAKDAKKRKGLWSLDFNAPS